MKAYPEETRRQAGVLEGLAAGQTSCRSFETGAPGDRQGLEVAKVSAVGKRTRHPTGPSRAVMSARIWSKAREGNA